MCWAQKCCFCFRLDLGGILVGLVSFIFSAFFLASSVALLCLDHLKHDHLLHLEMNQSSYDITLVTLIVFSALGLISSCLLVYGLRRNKPGFVLCYFGHGILLVIVMLLSALLELLKVYWRLALAEALASMILVHWLVVVHTIYELMVHGKPFDGGVRMDDEETLVDSLSTTCDGDI